MAGGLFEREWRNSGNDDGRSFEVYLVKVDE